MVGLLGCWFSVQRWLSADCSQRKLNPLSALGYPLPPPTNFGASFAFGVRMNLKHPG